MNGIELIAGERKRQLEGEAFDAQHDDKWVEGELAMVAALYALPNEMRKVSVFREYVEIETDLVREIWPNTWARGWWKPALSKSIDARIEELMKAGALMAAEIDRLQRLQQKPL